MAEAGKVRLVRCPKCENLLPELPDFSLYQCGGCGAVLKAKKKGILEDGLSEIAGDTKGSRISEEDSVVNSSEVEMESTNGTDRSKVERILNEKLASNGSSTSRAENKEAIVPDSDTIRRGKDRIRRLECTDDDYMSQAPGLIRNINQGKNCDLNANGLEYDSFNGEHAAKEMRPPMESLRSRPVMDQWGSKSNWLTASSGPDKGVAAEGRFNNYLYHDEGPSSHDMNSYYEYGERTRYQNPDLDGLARVENLEKGRAELLRKLEELKDQISRSCDVTDKTKERIGTDQKMVSSSPHDPYGRHHATYVQEGLISSHGINKQPLTPYDLESPYLSHTPGFIPYTDRYGSTVRDSYPKREFPHEFLGHGDTYRPEMLRRPPLQTQSQYIRRSYHEQIPGYYGDVHHDHFMLHHPHEIFFHQPACSCAHCYNKNWHLPHKLDRPAFHEQRSRNEPSNPNFHHPMNPTLHGSQGYSFGGSSLHQLHPRQPIILDSGDHVSENDSSNYHRPRKVVVAHRSGQVCRPIAGGAPFITCCNCFELLKLPSKYIASAKMRQKIKCAACSSIITFEVGNDGFIGSVSVHVDQVPTEIDNRSSGTVDENVTYWHGDTNSADLNGCFNEYNDLQTKLCAADEKSNSSESDKQLDPLSSTLSLFVNKPSPENITSRKQDSPSAELPLTLTEIKSFPPHELSSKEYSDHCSDNDVIGRFEKGNNSKRSEQERIVVDKTVSRQNSVTDAVPTEMDVSLNEFSNSCISQDSVEISKEGNRKVNKGSESFFAGLIKKSFRDLTKSNQSVEVGGSQVLVNGHTIPDRMVKKAEKLAGPIQPGEYWYDIHAGFWGVMGHPCLGIIMPNIDEFNYPIPKNCAAGNTGVFVNGRELHQKDLDLLASRGLPTSRHRHYFIEMSGKVVDEHTGEELDPLGKLAPTVERAKHGFGMKVPRFLAQMQS